MTAEIATKARSAPGTNGSIQSQPQFDQWAFSNTYVLQLATIADTFTPWGRSVRIRDAELRAFWPTEPVLASAIYRMAIRNANQTIILDGPPRTVAAVQDMFDNSDFGRGLKKCFIKASIDYYTQDNACFLELAGRRKETDPVTGINHLDAAWCRRTGKADEPVVYFDPYTGEQHRLAWFQVLMLEEMPSPIRTMLNVQYCALTRILRAAQIMRDHSVMTAEKMAGRFNKRVTLVSGVSQTFIDDRIARKNEEADNQGLARYMQPIILASLDPTQTPAKVDIDLATVPDEFNYDEWMRWYINNLAMGFGEDYQTFAPLPGRGLGSSAQSVTLDLKAQGAGPKTWTGDVTQQFRSLSVVPKSVIMKFDERDTADEQAVANVKKTRAETRQLRLASGEISIQIARNEAADDGDLKPEYLDILEGADANPDVVVSDEENADAVNDDAAIEEAAAQNAPKPAESAAPVAQPPAGINPFAAKEMVDALDEVRRSREWLMVLAATHKEAPVPQNYYITAQVPPANPQALTIRNEMPAVNPTPVTVEYQQGETHIHVEPTPVTIENNTMNLIPEQPAPLVSVPVTVKTPKVVKEETRVLRDGEGNMLGTVMTPEYEPDETQEA